MYSQLSHFTSYVTLPRNMLTRTILLVKGVGLGGEERGVFVGKI